MCDIGENRSNCTELDSEKFWAGNCCPFFAIAWGSNFFFSSECHFKFKLRIRIVNLAPHPGCVDFRLVSINIYSHEMILSRCLSAWSSSIMEQALIFVVVSFEYTYPDIFECEISFSSCSRGHLLVVDWFGRDVARVTTSKFYSCYLLEFDELLYEVHRPGCEQSDENSTLGETVQQYFN